MTLLSRLMWWREKPDDRRELDAAKAKAEDLARRAERLNRDNGWVRDVRRVIGDRG